MTLAIYDGHLTSKISAIKKVNVFKRNLCSVFIEITSLFKLVLYQIILDVINYLAYKVVNNNRYHRIMGIQLINFGSGFNEHKIFSLRIVWRLA